MFVIDTIFLMWFFKRWMRKNDMQVAVRPAGQAPAQPLPVTPRPAPPWSPAPEPRYAPRHVSDETMVIREHYRREAWGQVS